MAREGVVWRGRPGRAGRRRRHDRPSLGGVDGTAGGVEDGPRSRGLVRRQDAPEAVRLARVLPSLLRRARRPAPALLRAQSRSARVARLLGLARVLRPRRDLPKRSARLSASRVSARARPVGRIRAARERADVGVADVGAGRGGRVPARIPCRAQSRGATRRDRRRARRCRRGQQDPRRRGALRAHASARRPRAVRTEGRGGSGARAHPDERSLRGGDRAR